MGSLDMKSRITGTNKLSFGVNFETAGGSLTFCFLVVANCMNLFFDFKMSQIVHFLIPYCKLIYVLVTQFPIF